MDGLIAYALAKKYADEVGQSILDAGFKVQVEQDRSILNGTGEQMVLYLLPKESSLSSDTYDEYVYTNKWEQVGSTDIELDYNDLDNKPQINGVIVDGSKSNQDFGFSNFYYSPNDPPLYQSSSVNYQIHDIWIRTSPTTTANTFSTETPYILSNIWNQNTLIWEPLRVTVHISDDPYVITPPEYELEGSSVLKYRVGDLWMARRVYGSSSTTPRYEIRSLYICIGSKQQSTPPYNRFNITWLRLDNNISSATVNQDGTITFTRSDGSTFTTTGSSVIGPQGPAGADGDDYVLTVQDKTDIANIVLQLLPNADTMLFPEVSEVNNE